MMATLLDVPPAIMAVGKAISAAAGEAADAIREMNEEIEAAGASTSSSMSTAGDGSGGGKSMGADQAGAAVGTNSLGAALQMTRGRL